MRNVLIALALVGCKKDEVVDEAPGLVMEAPVAEAVDVQTGIVPLGTGVVARAVNAYGIATGSGPLRVSVGGADKDVSFDANGYGAVSLDAEGSAEVLGAALPAEVHAVDADWAGLSLGRGDLAPTDAKFAAAATRGWLVAGLYDVWWVSDLGQTHRVMKLPDGDLINGMRAGHVDSDGVIDAVVWAGDTVYLLRGRSLGGMSWGAGVKAEGYVVGGAAVDDCTGDGIGDVMIGWVSPNDDHHFQVLVGDGLWALDSYPPVDLPKPPHGVAIGSNRGEGYPQITITYEDGDYERYEFEPDSEQFRPTGPSLSGGFPAGAQVESGWDVNGDGGEELFFVGPKNQGVPRALYIYNLLPATVTWFALDDYVEAEFAIADMDGDNTADVAVLPADGEVVSLTYSGSGYLQDRVGSVGDPGPLAFSDMNADRAPEMLVAGQALWGRWDGVVVTEDDGKVWWNQVVPATPLSADVGLAGPVVAYERDGNPATTDLWGFVQDATNTSLVGWTVTAGETPVVTQVESIPLSSAAAAGVDLAICGGVAWALTETDLHRVDLGTRARLTLATAATRLDCGSAPSGAKVALLVGGTVELRDDALSLVSTEGHSGAGDLAVVQLGGAPAIGVCDGEGCSAIRWAWAADGGEALVTSDTDGVHVEKADGSVVDLGVSGVPSVSDVDGNGLLDLVVLDSGDQSIVTVFRSTGQGWGPAEAWHHQAGGFQGEAWVADVTGDGLADVISRIGSSIYLTR
jgi:hypothetical protein